MFGRINGNANHATTFVNYNGKTGLFTIDHNSQNEAGTLREHLTTTGRKVRSSIGAVCAWEWDAAAAARARIVVLILIRRRLLEGVLCSGR